MSSLVSGAEEMLIESRVNSQGRVVIPVEVRKRLGIEGEGPLHFMVGADDSVRITTPEMLRYNMWANNHGGDAGDSTSDVREMRDRDAESLYHEEQSEGDMRSDDELYADIASSLGL